MGVGIGFGGIVIRSRLFMSAAASTDITVVAAPLQLLTCPRTHKGYAWSTRFAISKDF